MSPKNQPSEAILVRWEVSRKYRNCIFEGTLFSCYGTKMRLRFICDTRPVISFKLYLKNCEDYFATNLTVDVSPRRSEIHLYSQKTTANFAPREQKIIWQDITGSDHIPSEYLFVVKISLAEKSSFSMPPCKTTGGDITPLRTSSVGKDLSTLFNNHHLSDIIIGCNGVLLPAHIAILSSRSEYFKELFRGDSGENLRNLPFDDIDPSVFRQVIYYLYTGDKPRLDSGNVRLVLKAAEKFQLHDLKCECAKFMGKNLSDKDDTPFETSEVAGGSAMKKLESLEKEILANIQSKKDLDSTWECLDLSRSEPEAALKSTLDHTTAFDCSHGVRGNTPSEPSAAAAGTGPKKLESSEEVFLALLRNIKKLAGTWECPELSRSEPETKFTTVIDHPYSD